MWVCRLIKFSSWGTFKNLTCEKDQSNGSTVVICSMLNIVFACHMPDTCTRVSWFIIIISHLPTAQLQHQLWGPKCIRHRHRQIHWAGHRSLKHGTQQQGHISGKALHFFYFDLFSAISWYRKNKFSGMGLKACHEPDLGRDLLVSLEHLVLSSRQLLGSRPRSKWPGDKRMLWSIS